MLTQNTCKNCFGGVRQTCKKY